MHGDKPKPDSLYIHAYDERLHGERMVATHQSGGCAVSYGEHVRLLKAIRDLALLPYPYKVDGPPIDHRFRLALEKIVGIAARALVEDMDETTWPPPGAM
jgi:hypothetical protein